MRIAADMNDFAGWLVQRGIHGVAIDDEDGVNVRQVGAGS